VPHSFAFFAHEWDSNIIECPIHARSLRMSGKARSPAIRYPYLHLPQSLNNRQTTNQAETSSVKGHDFSHAEQTVFLK
jgi:hypothetical protein